MIAMSKILANSITSRQITSRYLTNILVKLDYRFTNPNVWWIKVSTIDNEMILFSNFKIKAILIMI